MTNSSSLRLAFTPYGQKFSPIKALVSSNSLFTQGAPAVDQAASVAADLVEDNRSRLQVVICLRRRRKKTKPDITRPIAIQIATLVGSGTVWVCRVAALMKTFVPPL